MMRRLDQLVYRVERTLVVAFMVSMIAIVFIEVADRRLSSQDSKAAAFLLFWPRLLGWRPSEAASALVAHTIAPVFLLALFFALAWFAQATIRRTRGDAPRPAAELARAAALTALVGGLGLLMRHAPSNWFYAVLWVIVMGGVVVRARSLVAGGLAPVGALGLWLLVPPGYSWAKEVAMVLLVWTGFLGASMASHVGKHIDIDFGPKVLPRDARRYAIAAGKFLNVGFAAFFVLLGVWKTLVSLRLGDQLPYPRLPGWIVVAVIPLSFALISARTAGAAWQSLREEPK
ncbi:MAG TPA: TRAP transporter small permease [Polyangia bacterium]|nr:TRAP transporter small permease [Polyangia bacterium]